MQLNDLRTGNSLEVEIIYNNGGTEMAKIKKKGFASSLSLMRFFCDLIRPIGE